MRGTLSRTHEIVARVNCTILSCVGRVYLTERGIGEAMPAWGAVLKLFCPFFHQPTCVHSQPHTHTHWVLRAD